jgi:hypothetical protein
MQLMNYDHCNNDPDFFAHCDKHILRILSSDFGFPALHAVSLALFPLISSSSIKPVMTLCHTVLFWYLD